ncbi:hypothetical protein [Hymenobacter latericus]|uniref:hypothetical protein n=1 Tax=Hymenobacter sp. YIM 151858-1 TaxID=2987688 RepID=UPI0022273817|nr:hypothetical protein [Hymenobacter sp. YIM 151858-1]UYZ61133.1 hypothetical protein OIS50_09200 [Hymenobacter sp. YIM 151858-1]
MAGKPEAEAQDGDWQGSAAGAGAGLTINWPLIELQMRIYTAWKYCLTLLILLLAGCSANNRFVRNVYGVRVEYEKQDGWSVRVADSTASSYSLVFIPDTASAATAGANLVMVITPKSPGETASALFEYIRRPEGQQQGTELLPETGVLSWNGHDFLITSRLVHRPAKLDLLQRSYITEVGSCLVSFVATRPSNDVDMEVRFRNLMRSIYLAPEAAR